MLMLYCEVTCNTMNNAFSGERDDSTMVSLHASYNSVASMTPGMITLLFVMIVFLSASKGKTLMMSSKADMVISPYS